MKELIEKESKKETYHLIKGEFSPDEASEIVNSLLVKKINFHEEKNFSELIRFGAKNPETKQRIEGLKTCQKYVMQQISQAKETGKSLRINSSISIELI